MHIKSTANEESDEFIITFSFINQADIHAIDFEELKDTPVLARLKLEASQLEKEESSVLKDNQVDFLMKKNIIKSLLREMRKLNIRISSRKQP